MKKQFLVLVSVAPLSSSPPPREPKGLFGEPIMMKKFSEKDERRRKAPQDVFGH